MLSRISRLAICTSLLLSLFTFSSVAARADAASDRAEMQRQMNADNMASEFHTEDVAKIDTYIKDSMEKNLKPKTNPPENWQPGYSCDAYYYRHYSYNYYGYRDCLYHYRYYGRYW